MKCQTVKEKYIGLAEKYIFHNILWKTGTFQPTNSMVSFIGEPKKHNKTKKHRTETGVSQRQSEMVEEGQNI